MDKFEVDKLSLYRGRPYKIDNQIEIFVPKLGDICDYGESKYYSMVYTLCSVGIDLCWQLEEIGIDFDKISDFELFRKILCKGYSCDQTKILFGSKLDFTKMNTYLDKETNSILMIQKNLISVPLKTHPIIGSKCIFQIPNNSPVNIIEIKNNHVKVDYKGMIGYVMSIYISEKDKVFYIVEPQKDALGDGKYEEIRISEDTYLKVISCIRDMHGLKRDNRIAGTQSCRKAFIEDAKMEYDAKKNEPRKSILLPMISTMVNIEGFKRNDTDIWDMNIFAFMDSVKRIGKIRNASLLLQSGYSGFGIDLKKIKKDEIDYMGELN